jgi:hypothetical protein
MHQRADILKKVYEIAEELDSVKGHVPVLLWRYKFTEPTSEIREALGVSEPKKGSHGLYVLMFPKLQPITELQGADFFNVWKQCILCTWFVVPTYLSVELIRVAGHYDLWQAGVYHRDISPANMMWYRKGNDGHLKRLRSILVGDCAGSSGRRAHGDNTIHGT